MYHADHFLAETFRYSLDLLAEFGEKAGAFVAGDSRNRLGGVRLLGDSLVLQYPPAADEQHPHRPHAAAAFGSIGGIWQSEI